MTACDLTAKHAPDAEAASQPRPSGLFVFPIFPAESFAAVEMKALEPHLGSMHILSVRGDPDTAAEELAQIEFQRAKILHCAAGLGEWLRDVCYAFGKGRGVWRESLAALWENLTSPFHLCKTLVALAAALRIARLAGSRNFDFVYVFWGHYLSCCVPLLKQVAPRVRAMIFLGAYALIDYPRGLGRWARKADGIFTHSEQHLDQISAILGDGAVPPVFVVHRGIDLNTCRRLMGTPVHKDYDFCFVGRLVPSKGPVDFIEALGRLRHEGLTFSAAIVGDGPLRKRLAASIREKGLASVVHFLGRQPHDRSLDVIRRTKLLVLPSTGADEVFPNVIKEAMALDTACVAYDIPGVSAFNTRWAAVSLCRPRDIDGLVQAMKRLLQDGESRDELLRNGRNEVQRFDLERTTQKRLARIADVLCRTGSDQGASAVGCCYAAS